MAAIQDRSRDIIIKALSAGSWPDSVDHIWAALPESKPIILTKAEAMKVLAHSASDRSFCASLLLNDETAPICNRLKIVVNGAEHFFRDGLTEMDAATGKSLVADSLPQTAHPERFIAGLYQGLRLPLAKVLDEDGNTIAHLIFKEFASKGRDLERCTTELLGATTAQQEFSVWQQINRYGEFPLDLLLRVPPKPTEHFVHIQTIIEQDGCSRLENEGLVNTLTSRSRLGMRLTRNNTAWCVRHADQANLVL